MAMVLRLMLKVALYGGSGGVMLDGGMPLSAAAASAAAAPSMAGIGVRGWGCR